MLVLISSLKLSIVLYAARPESWGHSRTVYGYISMSNCFPSFIVHLILNFVDQSTHENHENWFPMNKSDFTVYKLWSCPWMGCLNLNKTESTVQYMYIRMFSYKLSQFVTFVVVQKKVFFWGKIWPDWLSFEKYKDGFI